MPPRVEAQLARYRHRLPHWRLGGATYFVTWRIRSGNPELTPSDRSLMVSVLEHFNGKRYELDAYVVMNDHVHVLCRPKEGFRLETILHSWKSFSSKRIGPGEGIRGGVWQDEYFDRIVRDEAEWVEKVQYISNNPRKRWPELQEYPWVSPVGS